MHEIQLKTLNVCSFQTRYVCIRKHNFLFCTLQLYSSCFKVVLLHLFTNILVLGGSGARAMWCVVWVVSKAGKRRSHREKLECLMNAKDGWQQRYEFDILHNMSNECILQAFERTRTSKLFDILSRFAEKPTIRSFITVCRLNERTFASLSFYFASHCVICIVLIIDAHILVSCNLLGACHCLVSAVWIRRNSVYKSKQVYSVPPPSSSFQLFDFPAKPNPIECVSWLWPQKLWRSHQSRQSLNNTQKRQSNCYLWVWPRSFNHLPTRNRKTRSLILSTTATTTTTATATTTLWTAEINGNSISTCNHYHTAVESAQKQRMRTIWFSFVRKLHKVN